ncbi:ComEC/Rec2 family competence protein [bacterium]|nr:ComEC/Rec2 family competence protein [bacterium]
MSLPKLFLFLSVSFITGIALESFFIFPFLWQMPEAFLFIFVAIFFSWFFRREFFFILFFCLLFVFLGILHLQIVEELIYQNPLDVYNGYGKKVAISGVISSEPLSKENQLNFEIEAQEIEINDYRASLSGKIMVVSERESRYQYGDKVQIRGVLERPQRYEKFDFSAYLAQRGIYSIVYYPEIVLVEKGAKKDLSSQIYIAVLGFKSKLRASLRKFLLPPQRSIMEAVILGDKSSLSSELKQKLNIAGVRHITAISGMHIAIIGALLMDFLIAIGLWRKQAFYLTVIFLALFILMIGLPSSALRAGFMIGIFLFSKVVGRKSNSFRALLFAATAILLINPLLLRYDVGFQLSFLAVAGIICLAPFLRDCFKFIPEKGFGFKNILIMTLSAQTFTLPVLVYNFKSFSLVAPLANILILPIIPFLIVVGFLSTLIGLVFPFGGKILSWPCWLMVDYILKVVGWLSSCKFSSFEVKNFSLFYLLPFYLLLGTLLLIRKRRNLFLKY